MNSFVISGGTIVNEGRSFVGDVVVRDGVIEGLSQSGAEIIDARGMLVLPGVIDPHVHFREPGLTAKGDMATESRAAVMGGVTTVLEMPNTSPATTSLELLEQKMEIARTKMATRYGFFVGATSQNILNDIPKFNASKLLCGVKVFIGSSTGDLLVDDERLLSKLFAEYEGVIVAHCEDEAMIREASERLRRQEPDATAAIHTRVRSEEACYRATARAVELADKYGTRLHVAHISTARELALFSGGDVAAKRITAEACVPHLWFSDDDYARLGNLIKCNPAIKTKRDRLALREALKSRKIDVIATDHAPHTLAEKLRPYWDAPSGIPMVQHSLVAMLELFPPELVVEKMCHAPAVRFGLEGGFLRTGSPADIVIVDPNASWVVGRDNIDYKCGWSPLEGSRLFRHRVVRTIIGGRSTFVESR